MAETDRVNKAILNEHAANRAETGMERAHESCRDIQRAVVIVLAGALSTHKRSHAVRTLTIGTVGDPMRMQPGAHAG